MLFLIVLSFSLFTIFYLMMQDKNLQQRILVSATESFSEQTGTEAKVSELEWGFPNSFILKDVLIEDREKDTLLSVERAKVTINIMPLLKSQISFRTIQFKGMDLRIRQNADGKGYNYDFLVEAFSNPNDTTEMKWSMDIESLGFTDCKVSSVQNKAGELLEGEINYKNLLITDLTGVLFVKHPSDEETEYRLHKLHAVERSGLTLTDLTCSLTLADDCITLKDLTTLLPNSKLQIKSAVVEKKAGNSWLEHLEEGRIDLCVSPSSVHLSDLSPVFPIFKEIEDNVSVSGTVRGTKREMNIERLLLSMGETMKVDGDFRLTNLYSLDSLGITANISNISLTADDTRKAGSVVMQRDIYLPAICDSLGLISYNGEVEGTFKSLIATGTLHSDAGALATNVVINSQDVQYNKFNIIGQINTHGLDLATLFGRKSMLGKTTFDLEVDLKKIDTETFQLEAAGKIDSLDFKDYIYQGIALNGKFDEKGFNGNFTLTDENINLDFEGHADLRREKPLFNFEAAVSEANLQKLHWSDTEDEETISFEIQANCEGLDFDNLEGFFAVNNLLYTKNDKMLYLNVFTVNTQTLPKGGKQFNVISDYLNGHFVGEYSFASLINGIKRMTYKYAPTIASLDKEFDPNDKSRDGRVNDFKFDFTLENTETINEVIEMPFVMQQKCRLTGFMNDNTDKYSLRLEAPLFSYKDFDVENALILLENPKDKVKLICRSTYYDIGDRRNPYFLSLNSSAKDDSLDLQVSYSNSQAVTNSGTLSLSAKLKGYSQEGLSADFTLHPSSIIVKDTTWNIHEGNVKLRPNLLEVRNIKASNAYQQIYAEGTNTAEKNDSIRIWFTDLDLDSFSKLLASPGITFGGVGDGNFYLTDVFKNPTVEGKMNVFDAYLNNYPFGDLNAEFGYDKKNNTLIFGTTLVTALESRKVSNIDGAVFFDHDSLFIDGHLRDVDMRFLRLYLDGVLSNNTGVLNTHVHALGRYDNIGLEGIGLVRDFGFDIDFTGCHYNMTDTVIMTQNSFRMPGVTVTDTEGNKAKLSALILHKGFFDWKYAMNVQTDRYIGINTTELDNELFYGKVYLDGNVGLSGTADYLNVDVNGRTDKGSKLTIPLDGQKDAKDANFITFRRSKTISTEEMRSLRRKKKKELREQEAEQSKLDIIVNANIEATPDAEVTLITDKKLGDEIRTRGHGNLKMNYTSKDDAFKLYGGYQIDRGDYQFTIQSVMARKFELLEGSSVRWNGDPTAAILDVNAKYSLSAYIGDILADDNISNTQVNCLMGVSGTISRPNIKFDLEMPNIDEDMMRKVKSVINTEEAMNRNVATLLAFGTFNTSDITTSSSSSGLSNVGFAALSSEISGLLSKINRDVNIGLNYRPYSADQTQNTTEFEVALSTGLLNNRLQLNGNFGYREGFSTLDASSNQSGIIDFDIEYKLSKNGRFRSKAFNRSSNSYLRNYNSQTQGVGLIYRQDYDSARELLNTYLTPFQRINARIEERRKGKKK